MAIPILYKDISFTPFYFYNSFLNEVAKFYQDEKEKSIEFRLVNEDDIEATISHYYIDPISIPLLLSLFEQLKKFHKHPLPLHLFNNQGTSNLLSFLYESNFFHLIGNERSNPIYPKGKSIFKFHPGYLGTLRGTQRPEHKVRSYSLEDDKLEVEIKKIDDEEKKRDYLIEYYSYKVKVHFEELLFNNENISQLQSLFIEILAELITNGVLHSKSDTFALMFSNSLKTKFSISDNGIGLRHSLSNKEDTLYYKRLELTKTLKARGLRINNANEHIQESIYSVFEALYYSMLKERKGLFDLLCTVVLHCKGYFRLHTENCQIIISNRMVDSLNKLSFTRNKILSIHNNFLFNKIGHEDYKYLLTKQTLESKNDFIDFYNNIINRYNIDTKFSSIRLFKVKFRGVHIEVEIPNSI